MKDFNCEAQIITCDVEVFAHNWLFVGKSWHGTPTVIWDDGAALREFMLENEDAIFVGFNIKHYDSFIIKAICTGAGNAEVKELNDFIIGGGRGWDHPLIRESPFYFNVCDLKDDMQMGLSLKAIEGHLRMPIEESSVPFDISRPLTQEEKAETVRYCGHDVDTARELLNLRKDYLNGKLELGKRKGIPPQKALYMTNAKLTAAYLDAIPEAHGDERDYDFPPHLDQYYIPQIVLSFFKRMRSQDVDDETLFKSKAEFPLGGCPCTVGFGGIHGALPCYQEEPSGTRIIRNYDVASLYPSLMIHCGYTSRNIPTPEQFKSVYDTRLTAKRTGDKATANTLKLVLNTTYGAMLNKYNPLYDPKMGRSVCVSGQLFLLELASRYTLECKSLRLIQLNTDGIMVSLEESELPTLMAINEEWQQRTHFTLEEDIVTRIVQKDVNNYLMLDSKGNPKVKGGYLTHGISTQGAWNINNNAVIVRKAIIDYFTHGTPARDTIQDCDDIFQFQLIAKAGTKYREAYHIVDGEKRPVQRVNRVYATKDERYGKLYKVHAETEGEAKIESLPDHCVIDNENRLGIGDVDKSFYIELAQKRVNDFLCIKPEKQMKARKTKMPRTTSEAKKTETAAPPPSYAEMNVYQKLLLARVMFLDSGVQKTGKNRHLEFMYFELDDIVPAATRIFSEVGLLPVVSFTEDLATMTIINTDAAKEESERIVFTSPMRKLEPVVSGAKGTKATNEMQMLGSVETYQRRYLYMTALDITEPDSMDPATGEAVPSPAPAGNTNPPKAPATIQGREEAKKTLTVADGAASELQVKQLKKALQKLREVDPAQEDWVMEVITRTETFTKLTKDACEKLLIVAGGRIAAAEAAGAGEAV